MNEAVAACLVATGGDVIMMMYQMWAEPWLAAECKTQVAKPGKVI